MYSLRLRALCTFELSDYLTVPCVEWDHDSCWSHKNSNKGGLFQLDYTLVSDQVQGEACVVRGGYHLNSDHWPIDAYLRLERKKLLGTVNQDDFSQRGWGHLKMMRRRVAKDLCLMIGEAKGRALASVEEIIYSALRMWSGLQNHRKRVAELRATLRRKVAREIRMNLRRDKRRELTAKLRMVKGEQLNRLTCWLLRTWEANIGNAASGWSFCG